MVGGVSKSKTTKVQDLDRRVFRILKALLTGFITFDFMLFTNRLSTYARERYFRIGVCQAVNFLRRLQSVTQAQDPVRFDRSIPGVAAVAANPDAMNSRLLASHLELEKFLQGDRDISLEMFLPSHVRLVNDFGLLSRALASAGALWSMLLDSQFSVVFERMRLWVARQSHIGMKDATIIWAIRSFLAEVIRVMTSSFQELLTEGQQLTLLRPGRAFALVAYWAGMQPEELPSVQATLTWLASHGVSDIPSLAVDLRDDISRGIELRADAATKLPLLPTPSLSRPSPPSSGHGKEGKLRPLASQARGHYPASSASSSSVPASFGGPSPAGAPPPVGAPSPSGAPPSSFSSGKLSKSGAICFAYAAGQLGLEGGCLNPSCTFAHTSPRSVTEFQSFVKSKLFVNNVAKKDTSALSKAEAWREANLK
jgi:hypothetical protein